MAGAVLEEAFFNISAEGQQLFTVTVVVS